MGISTRQDLDELEALLLQLRTSLSNDIQSKQLKACECALKKALWHNWPEIAAPEYSIFGEHPFYHAEHLLDGVERAALESWLGHGGRFLKHEGQKHAEELRESTAKYLELRGYPIQPDQKSKPAKTAEPTSKSEQQAELVATSPSSRVVLYGQTDKPIVDRKKLSKLTNAQYDVVLALLKSGTVGLTKDELEGNKTGRGGGRSVLYRLQKKPGWKAVIQLAGKTGNGYRIL